MSRWKTPRGAGEPAAVSAWRRVAPPLAGTVIAAATVVACLRLLSSTIADHDAALRLAELRSDIFALASVENAAEAGEKGADTGHIRAIHDRMMVNLDAATPHLAASDARALRADVLAYVDAVRTTVAGYESGSDVTDFDDDVTEPLLASLDSRTTVLLEERNAAARRSAQGAAWGLGLVLVGMSVTATVLVSVGARVQRREGARREAARQGARFRAIIENLREYVMVVDDDGRVSYMSPGLEGARPQGSMPPRFGDFTDWMTPTSLQKILRLLEAPAAVGAVQVEGRDRQGDQRYFEVVASDQRANPDVEGIVLTAHDVTDQTLLNNQLRALATTDDLTGLPNRRALNDASERAIARARRNGTRIGLVLVDLDGFKGINDAMGHPTGDDLLVQVAHRLEAECRAHELVVRLGGDEFAVLVEDVAVDLEVRTLARRLRDALHAPYKLDEHLIAVHGSLGVAVLDGDLTFDDLFRHADVALYEAKERGRNQVVAYEPGMDNLMQTEMRLRREMATGFSSGEFTIAYQPLLDMRTGQPTGLEALMRWNSSTLGPVSPVAFIPVAERSGMIVPLGLWALRTACSQLVEWQREQLTSELSMSVNVSIAQLQEPGFMDDLTRIIEETGIAPSDLILEVTESILAQRVTELAAVLERVRELGVRVALDDFGSGYSSMSQLQRLPVDEIKIDREFIQAMEAETGSHSLANTLLTLGHSLGLRTVAEGVENLEQLEALATQKCDVAQGFLFARPMPPSDTREFLRSFEMPIRHAADGSDGPAA